MKREDRKTFLTCEKPLLTAMVQAQTPQECKDIILNSIWDGAEAFGIQLENLKKEYRKPEILVDIFASCEGKPIYVTSYRNSNSAGDTDEECAKLLLMASECGATLCDIMGDYFHPEPHELTMDPEALNKQKALIEELHKRGRSVDVNTYPCLLSGRKGDGNCRSTKRKRRRCHKDRELCGDGRPTDGKPEYCLSYEENIGQEIPLSGKWTLQQTVASDRSQTWRVHVSLRTELWTAEFQGTAASAESENHA